MTLRSSAAFLFALSLTAPALAQTPLKNGPKTPSQRVAGAADVVATTLPTGSLRQAQAQANGNYGPLARPVNASGQIQEAWSRNKAAQGVHTQNDCGDCVYKVRLREFMVTVIHLPDDVKITAADLGDNARFEVVKRSNTVLAVKPFGAGVDSSMQVYTEGGETFSFYLRAEGTNSEIVPDLTFRIARRSQTGIGHVSFDAAGNPIPIKSEALPTKGSADFLKTAKFDPGALRGWDQYKLWGDKKLRPEQVFRDNQFTYIQFGDKWDDLELPTAYVVIDGIDELVNTRIQGTTYIVESTNRLITLKSGKSYLCIQYKGD